MSFIIGIFGLGLVVLIHEFGHFIFAKAFDVKVETFSIGWGPKLFRFQRGETEYCLSALPLGGYCKMKGETAFQNAIENNDASLLNEPRSFYSLKPWKRIIISLAGPVFNLLTAILVFSLIWFSGFPVRTYDNTIILASDYPFLGVGTEAPASEAGLQTGDRIIAINNVETPHYSAIQEIILSNPETPLNFRIERDNKTFDLTITPMLNMQRGTGQIGISAYIPPRIAAIEENSAAHIAGLKKNDLIHEINGQKILTHLDLYEVLDNSPRQLFVTVLRDKSFIDLTINPSYDSTGTNLGIVFEHSIFRSPDYNLFQSFQKGFVESFETIRLSLRSIGLLFRGIDLREAISGPIRITYLIGASTEASLAYSIGEGVINFFRMIGLLSVVLFFMNLLPIPALDGGQIVLNIVEIIKGDFLSPKLLFRFQMLGFFIIMILLVFVVYNDLSFLFSQ